VGESRNPKAAPHHKLHKLDLFSSIITRRTSDSQDLRGDADGLRGHQERTQNQNCVTKQAFPEDAVQEIMNGRKDDWISYLKISSFHPDLEGEKTMHYEVSKWREGTPKETLSKSNGRKKGSPSARK